MNSLLSALGAALSLGLTSYSHAQQPLPTPLCRPIPERAHWTLSLLNPPESDSRVVFIEVVVVRPKQTVVTRTKNGVAQQLWVFGDLLYRGSGDQIESIPKSAQALVQFSRDQYYGTEWITPETFRGEEIIGKTPCHVYERVVEVQPIHGIPEEFRGSIAKTMTEKAWIDINTRLPVQIERTGEKWTYSFLAPPSQIDVPAAVESAVAKDRATMETVRKRFGTRG